MEISRRKSGRNLRRGKTRKNLQKNVLLISNKKKKKKARKEVVHRKTQRKAPPQVRSKPWRPPVPPLPSRIPSQVNPYIHSCFGSLALSPGPSSLAATPRATRRRDLATAAPRASCLSETTARITQSGKANRNSRCCCCCVVVVVVFRKMTSPMPSWFSNFSCPQ